MGASISGLRGTSHVCSGDALLPSTSFSSRPVKDTDRSLVAKRISVVSAQQRLVPFLDYRSLATREGEGRCNTVCGIFFHSEKMPRRVGLAEVASLEAFLDVF